MNKDEFFIKRIRELANLSYQRDIVTFSDFLNLNEQNIVNEQKNQMPGVITECSGGYEQAERQMVAFHPDALAFTWEYPIDCLKIEPKAIKFSEDLTHRDYLTNAVTDGKPSAGGWFDSQVELMNEIMVYGCHVHTPGGDGATVPYNYTTGRQQFAAAMLNPSIVNLRYWYWLRDVVSSAAFALVGSYGYAGYYAASGSNGVRPYFLIG